MLPDSVCFGYSSLSNPFVCGQYGNCTWWAFYKGSQDLKDALIHKGSGRNAMYWYQIAGEYNLPRGTTPREDSIVVFRDCNISPIGHVAYVESVNQDGSFNVSQMDYYGSWGAGVSYRTFGMSSLCGVTGFIYKNWD